jgi:toxin ParE1/3/4
MAQIRWTPQAADDIESIAEYIAADSPHYAKLFVIDVIRAVDRLELFPNLGRTTPETSNPLIREMLLGQLPNNLSHKN